MTSCTPTTTASSAYLRKLAAEFAEQHPKIAGRLRLSGEATDDPHVERLLQGFAFIAARIHRKLDDDFPELTQGLLEVLYPHYLAPIPSMAIVELAAKPDLASPLEVEAGNLDRRGSGAGRKLPLPHRLPGDPVADRRSRRSRCRSADRCAGKPGRDRRRRGAAVDACGAPPRG